MTLLQIEHAATLADPSRSAALSRLIRTCREHDAEVDLIGRVEQLARLATHPATANRHSSMLNDCRRRLQQCEADILNLARLLVKEAEVTK